MALRSRLEESSSFERLVAELDDIDPAIDDGGHEVGQIPSGRRAEVEPAIGELGHEPRATCFAAALKARTFSRLSASTMSATERVDPGSE